MAVSIKTKQRNVYMLTVPTRRRERPLYHVQRRNESYVRQITDSYGWKLVGEYPGRHEETEEAFLFPHDTLIMRPEEARKMGIRSEKDFYGGLVPEPFLATKVIMHPLVSGAAKRPEGWSDAFAQTRKGDVPLGFAVFSKEDAKTAATQLLQECGVIRGKDPTRSGGRGQIVLRTLHDANAVIAALDETKLAMYGYIFERNLRDIRIVSIGKSRIDEDVISYYGVQRQRGIGTEHVEYAGTDLVVVRGDYPQLLQAAPVAEHFRLAIEQVARFHSALGCYEEVMASRMNIDIVQGYDEKEGNWFSILTDPSLRAGGAPELQALVAMKQDPASKAMYASSYDEYYQEGKGLPSLTSEATVHFRGSDNEFKPGKTILIYSTVKNASPGA